MSVNINEVVDDARGMLLPLSSLFYNNALC